MLEKLDDGQMMVYYFSKCILPIYKKMHRNKRSFWTYLIEQTLDLNDESFVRLDRVVNIDDKMHKKVFK